jgi:hypothetical protein
MLSFIIWVYDYGFIGFFNYMSSFCKAVMISVNRLFYSDFYEDIY